MLVVQRIRTNWKKLSRGGEKATIRNATPTGFEIPWRKNESTRILLHDIKMCEWRDFLPEVSIGELEPQSHIRLEPLFLRISSAGVALRFEWSWQHCGAPERLSHDLFSLTQGEWGRFECNGRFGATTQCGSEWTYHKTTFNVAVMDDERADLFLQSCPNQRATQIRHLK